MARDKDQSLFTIALQSVLSILGWQTQQPFSTSSCLPPPRISPRFSFLFIPSERVVLENFKLLEWSLLFSSRHTTH